jgi:glycosyltransferase involved in cell wall biosynthesis
MRVALVHDFLIRFGGAERVFLSLKNIFPKADIYTLLYSQEMEQYFFDKKVKTAFTQGFPLWQKYHRLLAPLMPSAIESLDLRDYDLVISSSTAFAKGIIVRPKTTHICYCHTPTRYVWDYSHQYDSRFSPLRKILVHYLRLWDRSASSRVDHFIANSQTTANRIEKYYGRESKVIYPPVRTGEVSLQNEGYLLIVSQLTPHKRIDLAVEACNKLGLPLKVIGEGRDFKRLKRMARSNVEFLGREPDFVAEQHFQKCSAFLFPGEDDFGIAPVEAMSYGKPVLAYRAGGATETIVEGITGEFFDDLAVESLADGIRRLKINEYDPEVIHQRAEEFSQERFDMGIKKFVVDILEKTLNR